MAGGRYQMERGWMEHPVFGSAPYSKREAWAYLIENAAWKSTRFDIRGQIVVIERGQFATSVRRLAAAWDWDKAAVSRFLTRLKTETMIETSTETGQIIITVCNYDLYQASPSESETPTETQNETPARQQRDTKEEGKEYIGYRLGNAGARGADPLPEEPEPPLGDPDWLGRRQGDPKKFAYVGRVLSVTHPDWAEFAEAYPNIELRGVIVECDAYLAALPIDDRRRTEPEASLRTLTNFLSRRNQDAKERSHDRTARRHATHDPAGSARIGNPGTRAMLALVAEHRDAGEPKVYSDTGAAGL